MVKAASRNGWACKLQPVATVPLAMDVEPAPLAFFVVTAQMVIRVIAIQTTVRSALTTLEVCLHWELRRTSFKRPS